MRIILIVAVLVFITVTSQFSAWAARRSADGWRESAGEWRKLCEKQRETIQFQKKVMAEGDQTLDHCMVALKTSTGILERAVRH